MKRAERGRGAGYTILETLIFLAVTAAMFASAMAFISGRQNRTEFASAVRDFETSINDIANDVSNGYYANITDGGQRLYCYVNGAGGGSASIVIEGRSTDAQGANQGCIFIGKALQFRSSATDGNERYTAISLVGKQYKNGSPTYGDAENYADSGVKAIADAGPSDSTPDATNSLRIGGGATVGCVLYINAAVPSTYSCATPNGMTRVDTVAFMTKFTASSFEEENRTGSTAVNLLVPSSGLANGSNRSLETVVNEVNGFNDTTPSNPSGGVHICLQSGGTNQHAWVVLGGKNSRFSASATIVEGNC